MIHIPAHTQTRYKALLIKKAIPQRYHYDYIKWLRYYLDFCIKYKFNQSHKESLLHFINKLREKNQPINNRNRHQMRYQYIMKQEQNNPVRGLHLRIKNQSYQQKKKI